MKIVKINPDLPTPFAATPGSVGLDLYANIEHKIHLHRGESRMIGTGIKIAVPKGYAGMLFPRSGKGSQGLNLKNTVGIIDIDYTGEVFANVFNYERSILTIHPKERFVQLVLVAVLEPRVFVVGSLDETDRGDGGFGSTGAA